MGSEERSPAERSRRGLVAKKSSVPAADRRRSPAVGEPDRPPLGRRTRRRSWRPLCPARAATQPMSAGSTRKRRAHPPGGRTAPENGASGAASASDGARSRSPDSRVRAMPAAPLARTARLRPSRIGGRAHEWTTQAAATATPPPADAGRARPPPASSRHGAPVPCCGAIHPQHEAVVQNRRVESSGRTSAGKGRRRRREEPSQRRVVQ
jgi:hypothetical protein